MKRQILIFCFLCIALPFFGQEAIVFGVVKDAISGETIVGAVLFNGVEGTTTDATGKYTFKIPEGKQTLSCSYLGYEKQSKDIEISAGESLEVNYILKPAIEFLNQVVISAGKFEQSIEELTVSMEVLKPALVQDRNTTSMDQVLQQTPGVIIVNEEPQIRSGSGYSFGAGSRVMVLMDDLPVLSGDAGKPTWSFLPTENLQQVEIIKGASSVLYGSSALSGVINVRTAYPKETPQTSVTLFHGVYSDPQTSDSKYWQGHPMTSGIQFMHSRKMGRLDLVVGGNILGDDGHLGPVIDEQGQPASSKYNPFQVDRYAAESRVRGNLNLRYRSKFPGLSFGVNTNWLKGESLNTLLWDNIETGLYKAYNGAATRTKQVMGTVDPFVEYTSPHGASHFLKGRWMNLDNNNDNNQSNYSDFLYGEYRWMQRYDELGVKGLVTSAGIVGSQMAGRSDLYVGGNDDGRNTTENIAGYIQAEKRFIDRITLSVGLRYEHFKLNDISASKPVFRAGANARVLEGTWIRGSYGEGFRFPSIAEKYIVTSVGGLTIYPNLDIQPETSSNLEIGIKQGVKLGRFQGFIDLAVFKQSYDEFVEFTFGQWAAPTLENMLGFGFRSLNTGRSEVTGLELSIMGESKFGKLLLQTLAGYTFTQPITLSPTFNYAYNYSGTQGVNYTNTSSDPTNNILKYRLQHIVRADVNAKYEKFGAGVSFRLNSRMQNIDDVFELLDEGGLFPTGVAEWRKKQPTEDYVFDARVSYSIREHHRLSIIVNNVFNREYTIRPLAIEPPRQTMIQYRFTIQ